MAARTYYRITALAFRRLRYSMRARRYSGDGQFKGVHVASLLCNIVNVCCVLLIYVFRLGVAGGWAVVCHGGGGGVAALLLSNRRHVLYLLRVASVRSGDDPQDSLHRHPQRC